MMSFARTWSLSLAACLALASAVGCSSSDDDAGGGGGTGGSGDAVIVTYNATDWVADVNVMKSVTVMVDDMYLGSVAGGWANNTGGFGVVTAKPTFRSPGTTPATSGTFQLVDDDFRDREVNYVQMSISGAHPDSLPVTLYSRSGTLELDRLVLDGSTMLKIAYTFDGVFAEGMSPPEAGDDTTYVLSGRVQFGGK